MAVMSVPDRARARATRRCLTQEKRHSCALCKTAALLDRVVRILLANGANPNSVTKPGIVTGALMRDLPNQSETPFIGRGFGARKASASARRRSTQGRKGMNGDSPLRGQAGIFARRILRSSVTTISPSETTARPWR